MANFAGRMEAPARPGRLLEVDVNGNPIVLDEENTAFCARCYRVVHRGATWGRGRHYFCFAYVGDWTDRTYWWKHTWEAGGRYVGILCDVCDHRGARVKIDKTRQLEDQWADQSGWWQRPVVPAVPGTIPEDAVVLGVFGPW